MDCKVSVIIPAYNCEKYIERCINSVLCCKDVDLEVIVVNDGSTDNTESVIRSMASTDSRIRLFNQTNQGVSKARNTGLSYAKGEYIIFSDSDDAFEGKNLKSLVDYAEKTESDVVVFTRVNHYDDGRVVSLVPEGESLLIESSYEEAFRKTILNQMNYGWSSCNKLFRREIIKSNNIRFIDYKTINSEDRLFNLSYFMKAKKVSFFDKCSFTNYVRGDSLSHSSSFPNSSERNIKAFEYVCIYLKDLPDKVRYKLLKHYFISFLNNVVVLELNVNKSGIKTARKYFRATINGMLSVLEKTGNIQKFKKEKSIFYADSGFKYKMLNALILNHKLYFLSEIMLFGYAKITRL